MPPTQGCCSHDHDCEATDCGVAYSLYKHIDLMKVRCLNASEEGTCRNVLRPWHDRLLRIAEPLRSNEGDSDLLLHIPFDGAVKLKGICIIGGPSGSSPCHLKAYINRDDIDFAVAADIPAVQSWDLQEDLRGQIEYPTQVAKFNGVHALDLHFTGCFGADCSEIQFIGLKGEFTERKRQAVEAVYETRALPQDHKVSGEQLGAGWSLG
ncbi:MAG: hypothetical protein WDW38_002231 [Sanguina aurantia]